MINSLAVTNKKGVRYDMLKKLFDRIEARKAEATIDIRDMYPGLADEITQLAKASGLDASGDGKFLLLRDLR
jgi:hypothetical protein